MMTVIEMVSAFFKAVHAISAESQGIPFIDGVYGFLALTKREKGRACDVGNDSS